MLKVIWGHCCVNQSCLIPPIIQVGMEPGRSLPLCLHRTVGGGRKEGTGREGGADVLGIKPCHLLLHPSAKKIKRICPPPQPPPGTNSLPKVSTPKRRGCTAAHLKGAKVLEEPPA